jgi:hypothetical protein
MSEQPSTPTPEVALYDEQLGVYDGVPPVSEYGYYPVSEVPYVHDADVSLFAGNESRQRLGRQKVIVAHGYARDGAWTLADGRPVERVVSDYNAAHPYEPITVAAICNPSSSIKRQSSEFSHAAGSDVGVSGYFEDDGTIAMNLSLKDSGSGAWHVAGVDQKTIIG